MNDIFEDELLAELQALAESQPPENEPSTITRPELVAGLHIGTIRAKRIVKQLVEDGVLEEALVIRSYGWNRSQRVPGYRFLNGSKKS